MVALALGINVALFAIVGWLGWDRTWTERIGLMAAFSLTTLGVNSLLLGE